LCNLEYHAKEQHHEHQNREGEKLTEKATKADKSSLEEHQEAQLDHIPFSSTIGHEIESLGNMRVAIVTANI
jgi:hypothetical protein